MTVVIGEGRGGVYQPIFPVVVGLLAGLFVGIVISNLMFDEGMRLYHTAGNPGLLIPIVNSGLLPIICVFFGVMVGSVAFLALFILLIGRI